MEFCVLGPLEVTAAGTPLPLGPPQRRAVLALLLIHANEVVSTDRLIDSLWDGSPPSSALQALRVHISKLRQLLEPARHGSPTVLVTRRPGYVLVLEARDLDSHRFECQLADAQECHDPTTREHLLRESLGLWRGPAYSDFTYHDFAGSEINRLHELRLEAADLHARAELELGHHEEVIGRLEQLTAENPLRESLRGSHMLALYRAGRQAEALRVYQDLRRELGEELGIEPTEELSRLEDQILLHDPALDAPPAEVSRHNLPTPAPSFVGRQSDLDKLGQLVEEQRIVALTGPPGVGKTRLAVEVASSLVDRFADGVWLVELAPLTDPELVGQTVASAVGFVGQPSGVGALQLADYLASRRMLIVLDNCEHVIEAVAQFVTTVTARAAHVHVLATSREVLRVDGEFNYPLAPLSFPDPSQKWRPAEALGFDAVELFRQRAVAANPEFSFDSTVVEPVLELCAGLDGLPLAIELAAARARTLPVAEIVNRLDDRLRLFSKGQRGALPHHGTLAEAMAWSYELATPQERRLLEQLSVFAGGFTAEAAVAVADLVEEDRDAVIDTLSSLVDKSMISTEWLTLGDVRYRMLETVRAFGMARLDAGGAAEGSRRRHAEFFTSLAQTADQHLEAADQVAWIDRLAQEQDNSRAALSWSLQSGSIDLGIALAVGLSRFWRLHGDWNEGRNWLARLLEVEDDLQPAVLGGARHAAGALALEQDDLDEAAAHIEAGLELFRLAGDVNGVANALNNLASLRISGGQLDEARALYEEALRTKEEAGTSDRAMRINLGWLSLEVGENNEARASFATALSQSEADGDVDAKAWAGLGLGVVAWIEGDLNAAGELFGDSVNLWERLEAKPSLVYGLVGQALVSRDSNDLGTAVLRAGEAVELTLGLGGGERYGFALGMVASLLAARGDSAEAVQLGAAVQALAEHHDWTIWSWFRADLEASVDRACLALDSKEVEAARLRGAAMTIGDAVREAQAALSRWSATADAIARRPSHPAPSTPR